MVRRTGGAGAARAEPAAAKSIKNWVSCDGAADDFSGVTKAFAAAKNGAFTLLVDCPVRIHSGLDIGRVIYIDNGTTVEFTGAGKFTVDNIMHPAFVIANSTGVTLTNWSVEFDASIPADPNVGGYWFNGQFVSQPGGREQPSGPWNDLAITPWLAANRGIVFDHVKSYWASPTNTCAVFFVTGDTSQLTVSGMKVYVPPTAGGDRFVPVVFSFSVNFKNNQTVYAKMPLTAQYFAVPHDLKFSNIDFDGTYMGLVGQVQNATFDHVRSHRYGDLQDANGGNVGGVGKWLAPPHLFYLTYPASGDPALFNRNIRISDVVDDGPRIGTARDKGGSDIASGYALSLKLGCVDCSVDNYTSTRPDGFLDMLPSNGLTISNVTASYDSGFLNNLYPGWRFPNAGYSNLTFENITIEDRAPVSTRQPIGNATHAESNNNIVFKNVHEILNHWGGKDGDLPPAIAGPQSYAAVDHVIKSDASHMASVQMNALSASLKAYPAKLSAGGMTTLSWTSKGVDDCAARGAWSGDLGSQGSRAVTLTKAGNFDFTMDCRGVGGTFRTELRVVVDP